MVNETEPTPEQIQAWETMFRFRKAHDTEVTDPFTGELRILQWATAARLMAEWETQLIAEKKDDHTNYVETH